MNTKSGTYILPLKWDISRGQNSNRTVYWKCSKWLIYLL